MREIDLRFALPGLARDDPKRHADRLGDRQGKGGEPLRRALKTRQCLERENDQRIARENRQRLAESLVNRWTTAPSVSRVETRQIVMHERGAMQLFKCGTRRLGRRRMIFTASRRDAVTKPWPHPRTAGKYRVAHGSREARRTPGSLCSADRIIEGPLDSVGDVHWQAPMFDTRNVNLTCRQECK